MKKIAILALLCTVVLSACALNSNNGVVKNIQTPSKQKYTAEDLQISIERTACFGACPTYSFKIFGDGKVVWTGYRNVKLEAQDSAMISQEEIVKLVDVFDRNGFYNLKDRYKDDMVSDLPSTTITINKKGQRKAVYGYFGIPKEFTAVAHAIDDIAIAKGWLHNRE